MSRGSSLLCAAVVGISAATFGCKSDEDAGAAFIRRYCELYQPCCVAAGLPEEELIAAARSSEKVQAHIDGQEPRVFVVPGKLVNFVV